jgi:hypothetical protein
LLPLSEFVLEDLHQIPSEMQACNYLNRRIQPNKDHLEASEEIKMNIEEEQKVVVPTLENKTTSPKDQDIQRFN